MADFQISTGKPAYKRLNSVPGISYVDRLSKLFFLAFSPYTLLVASILYMINPTWIPLVALQVVMAVSFVLMLYTGQDALLYHPCGIEEFCYYVPKPKFWEPEEVFLTTSDNTLIHGYFYKQPDHVAKNVPTVLFLHGNSGSVGYPVYLLLNLATPINIFAIDYRGYGKSEGKPSEAGLYNDGKSALEFLLQRDDINTNKIILYGHSLGGAVAIHLATRTHSNDVSGLIVENTFTSLREAACAILGCGRLLLHYLPDFCYKNKFNSLSKIASLQVPALFIAGSMDKLLPHQMTKTLYECCNPQHSRMMLVMNHGHNDTLFALPTIQAVSSFLHEFFDCDRRNPLAFVPRFDD